MNPEYHIQVNQRTGRVDKLLDLWIYISDILQPFIGVSLAKGLVCRDYGVTPGAPPKREEKGVQRKGRKREVGRDMIFETKGISKR